MRKADDIAREIVCSWPHEDGCIFGQSAHGCRTCLAYERVSSAITAARNEALEAAATVASMYEEENFRMAQDTILLDPILNGTDPANTALSDDLQMQGCGHAYSAHTAKHIAAAIRALKTEAGNG